MPLKSGGSNNMAAMGVEGFEAFDTVVRRMFDLNAAGRPRLKCDLRRSGVMAAYSDPGLTPSISVMNAVVSGTVWCEVAKRCINCSRSLSVGVAVVRRLSFAIATLPLQLECLVQVPRREM